MIGRTRARTTRHRWGWYLGSLILAFLLRLHFAHSTPLLPDEQLHVFISRIDDWSIFAREILLNSHPPLFYLLLKAVLSFDHSLLAERAVSIACGLISIVYMGKISRKLGLAPPFEIFAVLATTLSISHIMLSIEVRSYMLTTALTLISFHCYLDWVLLQPTTLRRRAVLYLATAGAALSHFSAVISLAAIAAVPILFAAADGSYRQALREAGRRFSWRPVYALDLGLILALGLAYAAFLRAWAGGGSPKVLIHVGRFLRQKDQSTWDFFLSGTLNEFNLFSPILVSSPRWALIALGLLVVAAAVLVGHTLRQPRRELPQAQAAAERVKATIPFASTAVIFSVLFVLGCLHRYPFGGELRHQFVVFPFLILCYAHGLSLLVGAISREGRLATRAVVSASVVIALFNFAHEAARVPEPLPRWTEAYSPSSRDAARVLRSVGEGGYLFLPTHGEFLLTLGWFKPFELRTRSTPDLPVDLHEYFDERGVRRLSVVHDRKAMDSIDISRVEELQRLRRTMRQLGTEEITVYSKRLPLWGKGFEFKSASAYHKGARRAGMRLVEFTPVGFGVILKLESNFPSVVDDRRTGVRANMGSE